MPPTGLRLKIIEGPDQGRTLRVERVGEGAISIGREVDPERDLLLEHDQRVSRLHAVIEPVGDGFQLIDRSRNGTMRNGELLTPNRPVRLQSGDRIHFGPETVATFEILSSDVPKPDTSGGWHKPDPVPPPAPPTPPKPKPRPSPTETFGQFAVQRLLAESDSDRVDYAIDEKSGTAVALKRYNSGLLIKSIRRDILDEAARAREWDHWAIARLVAAGEQGGTLYVATEYVDGVSLADLHRDHASEIDSLLAAFIGREACAALAYILGRDRKFVHRYLSPACFVVGRDGRVALINYGSPPFEVRIHGSRSTNRFAANEARQNRPLDARSDVCSLGRILYELLSQQEINLRVPALPDVKTIRTDIPRELQEITNRAVKINPPARYPSAIEMAEALTAALGALDARFGATQVAQWMTRHCPPA